MCILHDRVNSRKEVPAPKSELQAEGGRNRGRKDWREKMQLLYVQFLAQISSSVSKISQRKVDFVHSANWHGHVL